MRGKTALGWVIGGSIVGLGAGCELIAGLGDPKLDKTALCSDGIKDGDETSKDCGGSCSGCPTGAGCQVGPDCASKVCRAGTCVAPTCTDQIANGDETDVDCGRSCSPCGPEKACSADQDCKSNRCVNAQCASTCSDQVQGGEETDIDCGGAMCPPCANTKACGTGPDCQSGVCKAKLCVDDHIWSEHRGGTGALHAGAIAVDAAGYTTLGGTMTGIANLGGGSLASAGSDDILLAKFDPSGSHVWSKRFGDASSNGYMSGIGADAVGNISVTGQLFGAADFGGGPLTGAGNGDIFVAKFSPPGGHLWSKVFGDSNEQYGPSLAVDTKGNTVVTGSFYGAINFGGSTLTSAGLNDIFLVKFSTNGNHVWSKRFGDADVQTSAAVAVDSAGNIVLTGSFDGTIDFGGGPLVDPSPLNSDIFVTKVDTSGNHLWSKHFGDSNAQRGTSVAVDVEDHVVIAGELVGTADFGGGPLTSTGGTDIFIAEFDASGNHLWSKRFGDQSDQSAPIVTVDAVGNVILAGKFLGTIDLGGGALANKGPGSIFLAKFDATGNYLWSKRFGDAQAPTITGVAAHGAEDVVFTGDFSGTIDLGGGELASTGTTDIFLARLRTP